MRGLFVDCVAQACPECILRGTRSATALGLTAVCGAYEKHLEKGYLYMSFAQFVRARLVGTITAVKPSALHCLGDE